MVHRREINGSEIVLGNHGALWGNAMTWYDHGTGSVWSQPIGEAILGPLKGETLGLLPSTLTRWGDWVEAHPDSFALDAPATPNGFALQSMAIVVELNDVSVAFPVEPVRERQVVNSEVGGAPIAVRVDPLGDNWAVFSRQLDDRVVELESANGSLVEIGGAGRWDPNTGLAVDDDHQDLGLLPGFSSFPNDYVTFFADGAFWQPQGIVSIDELLGR